MRTQAGVGDLFEIVANSDAHKSWAASRQRLSLGMEPWPVQLSGQKGPIVQKCSIYEDCQREENRHKWIESEKAGKDLGETAVRQWVKQHWCGYLRACWLEHLQGKTFWIELDRGDFGLLTRRFEDQELLLDRILDRLKTGQENLQIILWAIDWHLPMQLVLDILTALDINSRRLSHRFDH